MNEQIKAIRNEIERLEEIHERNLKKPMERGRIGFAHGVVECCDKILDFIDSLPEETDNGVDVTDFCKPIAPGIAQCIADHWWEMLDDDESSRPKLSDNLEEAAEDYIAPIENDEGLDYINFNGRDIKDAFIAGAKWQAEQEKDEWLKDRDGCFWDGVEEGKKAMEKQVMKDAVEGYVNYYEDYGGILMAEAQVGYPYHNGEKVHIIIVKEDER